jgi:EAL domain-containing protein (putative c-di-GMP-specific phosphodiesterase class I)
MTRLLLADDDLMVLRAYGQLLSRAGFTVDTAASGTEALERVAHGRYDAIISDLDMPGLDGLSFLRAVRAEDLDVPVLLVTGGPALETAVEAIEHGAFRYFSKPITGAVLIAAVTEAVRLHRLAKLKREALAVLDSDGRWMGDKASMEAAFGRALALLWMAYQPVLDLRLHRIVGYEGLLRSDEPTLARPDALLDAAERLGRMHEVGRRTRAVMAATARTIPDDVALFVNIHPIDLEDEELYSPDSPLSKVADRAILEITERVSLESLRNLRERANALREMGFRLAVDDLGAGYAGLNSLAKLQPDVVKIDMALIRQIDESTAKQRIVGSMARLCEEMQVMMVAEGVETVEERRTLDGLGCGILQGFLFARPTRQPVAVDVS